MPKVGLLDCTLRDGGYVNDWQWGFQRARSIIRSLVKADIDIVEVGFLRNVEGYNPDVTVCNTIEELNKLLPKNTRNSMFSAMAMRSNYDISKLSPYSGSGIQMIRVTAHDYDIKDGMDFAREVKEKGYLLSVNPINIMGYTDAEILWIIQQVNEIEPYQFSIVDTFGSMKPKDLDRIVSLVDNNLHRNIRVSLHLHENMSLSSYLAQRFIEKHLSRAIAVDGSLMGMGRNPGNLPIELIADYLNEYSENVYDIDYLMDAIQDHIAPIKGDPEWGYTPAYFLSARFNLHRNYAEHYLAKGDLTNRDINHILSRFDKSKATVFDAEYADALYEAYKNMHVEDDEAWHALRESLAGREVLVLAPGATLNTHKDLIDCYVNTTAPIVISTNFAPSEYKVDYAFFSNNKRFSAIEDMRCKVIATSNLDGAKIDYRINYNSVSGSFKQGCNAFIMLLKLLKKADAANISVAGADGYATDSANYCNEQFANHSAHGTAFNLAVAEAIKSLGVTLNYITPSKYETLFCAM